MPKYSCYLNAVNLQIGIQAIVLWPSMLGITYCATRKLGPESSVGSTTFGSGMSASCYVSSEVDSTVACNYEEIELEKEHSTLVQRYDGQPLPQLGTWLIFLHCPSIDLFLPQRFDYPVQVCNIELHLRGQARGILPDGITSNYSPFSSPMLEVLTSGHWLYGRVGRFCLRCVPMSFIFA